ncbi:hypothetical protein CEE36_01530 [candidate division TA06 bacterium B3_TA06]|uniref:Secretion system C-terminal sorting domain-containing protein n=1 Tax=candidate division TA06 bacterium B3_TA06 TaxID=2012487 RepID=A0A532V9F4_UNCT6|nr:MAG: hypothetical protein CEE36_01530 [candidate division TA06 bacterium B3_TA06]
MKNPPATPVPIRGIFTITRSLRSGRKDITPVTPLILIIAGLLAITPPPLHAGWIRYYGDKDAGLSVQQTTDGGYIIVGLRDHNTNIWLLKTDSEGDTLWTRTYGGEAMDQAYCVQQTSDGGYIIVGMTRSFARLGNQDLWLLKTDSEGDTLWTRIYGVDGGLYDNDEGSFVQETPDGGYIVIGSQNDTDGLATNFWLLKTDEAGDTLWTRIYDLTKRRAWNWGSCIRQIADGGYIFTGYSTYPDSLHVVLSLVKTDPNGDTLWTRLYGEEAGAFGTSVQQTPDGGYIIAGFKAIPEPPDHWVKYDFWLLKTDENGDTLWTRIYDWEESDQAQSLDQTMDGGYIIVGWKGNASPTGLAYMWLAKTDEAGDTLWTRTFGERNGSGQCVHQTLDGGYIITGVLDGNLCLIKTDSLGDTTEVPTVSESLPLETETNWHIVSSIGRSIVLQYKDLPQGFHASVFDATGRRVDEIHSGQASGIIAWGGGYEPGVYFIKAISDNPSTTRKVILIQ